MWNRKDQQRQRNERIRGWIIYFLYQARPGLIECPVLINLLDARNLPLTRRRLAEELDYLRSLRLLRIFPATAEQELDEVKQAKLIQRYVDTDSDGEMGDVLCARITTAGINFQDGLTEHPGIARVE
jgi:hypothetical protein